ncbi:MAG TPA: hypothetical protein VFJ87_05035 [Rhodanobacteraceae bacterium]|jgi:hypothetical protein|nr:hypothetical protein [Rhodanobacteraceae bacterium]
MTRSLPVAVDAPSHRIAQQILDFLSDIPASHELPSEHPRARAEAIAVAARRKAFLASSSLALPPGPLGWLTVLPELVTIWKIQAKMVSDIAAACGQHAALSREQMLYCLFRHAASQAVRDLVVRAGQRMVVQAATAGTIRRITERIGIKLSERVLGSSLARFVPVAGALGVGAYAWYDTRQVARTAIAMFTRDIEFTAAPGSTEVPAQRMHADLAQAAREAGL